MENKNIIIGVLIIFVVLLSGVASGCITFEDAASEDQGSSVQNQTNPSGQTTQTVDQPAKQKKSSSGAGETGEIVCPNCGSGKFSSIDQYVDDSGELFLENKCLNCGETYWIDAGPESQYQ